MLQDVRNRLSSPTYGWVIVGVAALAMVATLPGRTHGLAYVTERILADPAFDLSGTAGQLRYSEINFWASILGAAFCLPCGYLIDRFGLRWPLVMTILALAGAVFWMTRLSGNTEIFTAILLTRGFGQSALSVISIALVGKWFRGRLGVPMAAYTIALSLGFAAAAPWARQYRNLDWRVVWGHMGWILLVGVAPLALVLSRDPPAGEDERQPVAESPRTLEGFTLPQALRTTAFWVFGLAISVVALIGSGISLFYESVLALQGFSRDLFYDLIALGGLVGLCAQLPVGWLSRHVPLGKLQAPALLLLGGCLLWLPLIREKWQIGTYAVLMSLSGAVTTILFFTVWGQAYGRAHLGRIQGVAQMLTVLSSAAGPVVLAYCKDRFGSYTPAFQAVAGAALVLAAASWWVHVPTPSEAPCASDQLWTDPPPQTIPPSNGD